MLICVCVRVCERACVYIHIYIYIYEDVTCLMAGAHWLSIDLPFAPSVGELLKFIFPVAQVRKLFHSVCMHTFISVCVCVCVCVRDCVGGG